MKGESGELGPVGRRGKRGWLAKDRKSLSCLLLGELAINFVLTSSCCLSKTDLASNQLNARDPKCQIVDNSYPFHFQASNRYMMLHVYVFICSVVFLLQFPNQLQTTFNVILKAW